jgi:hypothetical protein
MVDENVEILSGNAAQGENESLDDYRKRRKEESKRTIEYLRKRSIIKGMKKS